MTDRIVEMEAHILELGSWGKRLDKEIEEKNSLINNKLKELDNLYLEKKDLENKNKLMAS
jgi:hypothetical protein